MTLSRDEIIAKRAQLPRESVEVPELGGSVLIRTLTLHEVSEVQKAQKSSKEPLSSYPKLVALACIKEDGTPLFVGEDIKLIDELPWPVVDAIATAVLKLNRMLGDEKDPKA